MMHDFAKDETIYAATTPNVVARLKYVGVTDAGYVVARDFRGRLWRFAIEEIYKLKSDARRALR